MNSIQLCAVHRESYYLVYVRRGKIIFCQSMSLYDPEQIKFAKSLPRIVLDDSEDNPMRSGRKLSAGTIIAGLINETSAS